MIRLMERSYGSRGPLRTYRLIVQFGSQVTNQRVKRTIQITQIPITRNRMISRTGPGTRKQILKMFISNKRLLPEYRKAHKFS